MEALENINRYHTGLSEEFINKWINVDSTGIIYNETLLNELRDYTPPIGPGLFQQVYQGNRVPYQELTRERLEEVFSELFYANRDFNRQVNIGLPESIQNEFWRRANSDLDIKITEIHFPF